MKKAGLLFIIPSIVVCAIPLLGMTVRPTTETTENRNLSAFPQVKLEDGSLNRDFFSQFETWFSEHFAFRNELVYADARIQGDVFGVSAEDGVIYGKDDWLFYTSSLKDFTGTDRLTERGQYALKHNLAMAAEYAENRGVRLVLAVPPNKNTLYGEHMPYYDSLIADGTHTVDLLGPMSEEAGLSYADLTNMFRDEEEVMYLKRDSHWNNKGAMMAYDRIMGMLGCPYDSYEDIEPVWAETENGDLNRMLYSFYGKNEYNYTYDIPQNYQVTNGSESVEDTWIETSCPSGSGKLVMFRDSFANTLIPMIANQFAECRFTKEGQYRLEKHIAEQAPDYVIMEKGERALTDLIRTPPVISAPAAELPVSAEELPVPAEETQAPEDGGGSSVDMVTARIDYSYFMISGNVDPSLLKPETDIIVSVNGTPYEAYLTGDDTFALYMKKEAVASFPARLQIMTKDDENVTIVLDKTIESVEE